MSDRLPIVSVADVVKTMAETEHFGDYRVVRTAEHLVEVTDGAAGALLADPTLWSDPEEIAVQLAACTLSPTLLVCLGDDRDLRELAELGQDAFCSPLLVPTTTNALRTSLANSMALVALQARAEQRGRETERFRYELQELVTIAASLNSERDINRLLALILEKSRYITSADAGSVYVVVPHTERDGERMLRFAVAQNESMEVGGLSSFTLEISPTSIVGAAVLSHEVINIPDLYQLDQHNPWGVTHNRSFDERTGYHTRSALTVPMINHRDQVIGVIQLINKKRRPKERMKTEREFAENVVPFDDASVELCKTLAYQAAIALDNALLYEELRGVFEGFVEASVLAIEARDPTTSGHSRRVADFTLGLARAADRAEDGPYRDLTFNVDELKEIEYAALLHDFGKVSVPEQVLLKANKLYGWNLDQVLLRFDFIREAQRNEALHKKLEAAAAGGSAYRARAAAIDAELAKRLQFLDHCVETIHKANRPTVLEQESAALLEEIGRYSYVDPRGETRPYLTAEEVECLRIRRGSLNDQERAQIESHVVHSYNFLCTIPWGRTYGRIPVIAGDHHEKLDGTGYPAAKPADAIPVQARMMTISDIYDALTAADRPYKKALPVERALDILAGDVKRGKLDVDLFELFVGAKVHLNSLKS